MSAEAKAAWEAAQLKVAVAEAEAEWVMVSHSDIYPSWQGVYAKLLQAIKVQACIVRIQNNHRSKMPEERMEKLALEGLAMMGGTLDDEEEEYEYEDEYEEEYEEEEYEEYEEEEEKIQRIEKVVSETLAKVVDDLLKIV